MLQGFAQAETENIQRFLERETGVEPATSSLGSWHSTTELLPPRVIFNYFFTLES